MLHEKATYEILFHAKPSCEHIRVFDYLYIVYNNQLQKEKFGPCNRRCNFFRYPHGKNGWRVYDLDNWDIFVSRVFYFV